MDFNVGPLGWRYSVGKENEGEGGVLEHEISLDITRRNMSKNELMSIEQGIRD